MKRAYTFLFFFLIANFIFADSDVKKLGPFLPTFDLTSSAKVGDKLILGGDMGFFLELDDQKNIVSLNKSNADDELAMYSLIGSIDESGFATGTGGSLFKLENNNWKKVDFVPNRSLQSINSFGDNRFIITAANGKFYTSIDMGITWSEKDASILLDINCSIVKDDAYFLFGNNGLVITSNDFFETFTIITGSINGNIAACCRPDESSDKLLLFTHEGQIVEMNTADTSFTLNYENEDFTFTDWAQNEEMIVATASENSILVSNNRGASWTEKPHSFASYFYTVEYFNREFVLAGDDSHIVLFDNNQFEKLAPESDIDFQEAEIFNSALFAGTSDGKILKSTNYDNQWETLIEISNVSITGLATNGTDELLFSTTANEIHEFNSQSNTFSVMQTGITESGYHGIYYTNDAFFCVAESGNIYKRNSSWEKVYQTSDSLAITDIYIDNIGEIGFAVGDQGKILKTTDSGNSWNAVQSDIKSVLFTLCYFKNTWYIGGMNGTLVYSSDGTNWMSDSSISNTEESFSKIAAHPNGNDLLVTTVLGKTILLNNDAMSWEVLAEGFSLLTDVVWKDKLTAYSLGYNSALFQINLDAPVSAQKIENQSDILVYPLPAKNILYVELPRSEPVSEYQVYNLQGKLFLKDFVENNTRLEINVSDLNQGIYLLKLVANKREFSKKFVVH